MANRCLVTGCAGFIASRVAEMLLDRGDTVVGVDNLSDAYDPRLKRWRLARLEGRERFSFVQVDIADPAAMAPLFDGGDDPPFACVFNLAARAGVRASVANPRVYYEANTLGALTLLEASRKRGVPKFVLSSSSSAYGEKCPLPFREDADTSRPLSPYAASKLAAESLAYAHHHLHGLDVTVLRYFTVYGPAGRPDMSFFRFVRKISEGEPITVFGDGTQGRDFTYIDDIARGTIAAERPLGYEIVNLGGDRPIELREMIAEVARQVGRDPMIEYAPRHPADVTKTWASIEKAKSLLDWSPRVSLKEGVARCVAWHDEHRELALSIDLGE